jgi:hypothetical protein
MQAECIWTSALNGDGVDAVFGTIGRHLMQLRVPERFDPAPVAPEVKEEEKESSCC